MVRRILEARRSSRVALLGPVPSWVNGRVEAAALDLSVRGVRLEHREVMRPGQVYTLQFHLPASPLPQPLVARVVWSWVHRFEPGREPALVFHSGLEFLELPAASREALTALLADVEQQMAAPRLASAGPTSLDGAPAREGERP